MRHNVRDSKGRFAKARHALAVQVATQPPQEVEELEPEEQPIEESLLISFLQVAAVCLLALFGGMTAIAVLYILRNL